MAAMSAEKRMSKPRARKAKGDHARIARAIRLLRKGAISKAGQALESKGIGDLEDPEIREHMKRKHPSRKEAISEEYYKFQTKEEVELKVGKILPKLDMIVAPGPSLLRNTHLRLWTGVFAPPATDEAIQHLEELLSNMANDKLPGWFMQAVNSAELMALVKAEKKTSHTVADHMPVQIPNTLAKVGDKAMLEQGLKEYVMEMMP